MERNKVILLCVAAILFAAAVGVTAWGMQVDNARKVLEEENRGLQERYNETSEELEEIKSEFKDKGDYYERKGIWLNKEKGSATVLYNMDSNSTISAEIKFDENGEIAIVTSQYNATTLITQWNCTGEECLMQILQDIKDEGNKYKWKGISLYKEGGYATTAIMVDESNKTRAQGIIESPLSMRLFTWNETTDNWIWKCSGKDCLDMTI